MFGEDGNNSGSSGEEEASQYVDKVATHAKFRELSKEYTRCRGKSTNEYDFFNLVERCILGMEEDETPDQNKKTIPDKEFEANGLGRDEMHQITQHIRVLSM